MCETTTRETQNMRWSPCFVVVLLVFVCDVVCKPPITKIDCIPVTECPVFVKLLRQKPLVRAHLDVIQSSHCGFEEFIEKVWCPMHLDLHANITTTPTSTTTTSRTTTTSENPMVESRDGNPLQKNKGQLFPNDTVCGQNVDGDKIFGGEVTQIDEYPWMAILYYGRTSVKRGCGGVLINQRYVLTAAHCLKRNLKYIVLGEYDVRNETDCIYYEGSTDCADKPLKVRVKTKIPHPLYRPGGYENDIALLRLKRDVVYTEFIAPICLPSKKSEDLKIGTFLRTVGWGWTEQDIESPVKLQVDVALASRTHCSQAQGKMINSTMICAGGEKGKDSCFGDSGGPLMHFDLTTFNWRQVGIVSFSLKPCGAEGVPAVYTYLPPYLEWIHQNVY